jgi:hypothetical protein
MVKTLTFHDENGKIKKPARESGFFFEAWGG